MMKVMMMDNWVGNHVSRLEKKSLCEEVGQKSVERIWETQAGMGWKTDEEENAAVEQVREKSKVPDPGL